VKEFITTGKALLSGLWEEKNKSCTVCDELYKPKKVLRYLINSATMKLFFVTIFTLFFTLSSSAQNDEDLLRKLEYDWLTAEFKNDTAFISKLIDDSFIAIEPTKVSTKKEELDGIYQNISERIKNGHVVDSLYFEDFHAIIYNNSAVVTFIAVTKGSIKKVPFTNRRTRIYDVWIRKNGKWKAVSSQVTPIR